MLSPLHLQTQGGEFFLPQGVARENSRECARPASRGWSLEHKGHRVSDTPDKDHINIMYTNWSGGKAVKIRSGTSLGRR
ncbi:hypothetical protein RRG08_033904 [Elysia crispata]|uniref:Uncharacterized protein n=1 Tax=Elysia crispata TaxID=231223 RepID=A0AAE1ECJ7_9GAST|nr:hypothetical protein RRG08_033904 [Elysia crispata]